MRKRFLIVSAALSAVLFGWRSDASAQPGAPTPAAQPSGTQGSVAADSQRQLPEPQVLEQGPIHEAFADPMALQKQGTEILDKQPPEPVNELPPEQQPEGQNVQWIPGYWLWDQGRDDFVWVSGMWRDVPPGRTWVPGEWQQVEGGYQWVPGFWADAKQEQVQLLPEPPETLETGPTSPSPGENYLWAPGNWYWQNSEYVWQPGYWYEANPNWVWVPNHYSYTPKGYCYVSGYWDYQPYQRGWLYAPVYWGAGYRGGYGYGYYRPRSVINTALLIANLAVYRPWGHYYYGSWGGGYPGWLQPWGYNYGRWGYTGGNYFGYDPLWSYFRWSNRNNWDNDWWRNRNNWYGRDRDWNDWNRWSWDGRRGGDWDRNRDWDRDRDWDGRPGDRDGRGGRDGRPGDRDGRPGDRGPRDRDIADRDGRPGDRGPRDRDGDRRGPSLVTSVDDLTRDGRGVRSRELSQTDLERIRNRSQELRSRRDNIVADANRRVGDATDSLRGRNRQGGIESRLGTDGRGQASRRRSGAEGQLGVDGRGQATRDPRNRGRADGQLGAGGRARVGDSVRSGTDLQSQLGGNRQGQGRGRGQVDADAGNRTRNNVDAGARVGADGQVRRGPSPRGNLDLQGRGNVDRRNLGGERSQVQRSIDQLRGRSQQGPNIDGRTFSRGQQGPQVGDRPRGQSRVPGNVQRSLEGPVQQRVMRLPSGQQVMPQGQNFRSQRLPQGDFNRRGGGQRSIQQAPRSIQRSQPGGGGGGRSIQQAPRSIQRSLPGGGGGRSFQGGGGGGRSGGEAFRGGGGGRGGGPARGGGGGRGRGGRD